MIMHGCKKTSDPYRQHNHQQVNRHVLILSCWKSQLLKYLNVLTSAAAKQNDVINKCRLRTCTYLNKIEAQLYQACSREVELESSLGRRLGCPKRATKRQVWVGYRVSITINSVIVVSVSGQTPSKSFMKTQKFRRQNSKFYLVRDFSLLFIIARVCNHQYYIFGWQVPQLT